MTEQKHTVATDALATIGNLIDETAGRDAIHLAVEPVTAGAVLHPGQDIGLRDGKAFPARPYVGIVDPFLSKAVQEGERFWLVVYPRQITSLRHVWEHPSFPATTETPVPDIDHKAYSVQWMQRWAKKHMSADYYGDEGSLSDEQSFANAIDAGRNLSVGGFEDARDHIDDEWWNHWEVITGETGKRGEYFRCAC